jgi:serine/threonine-protein kinase
MAPEQIRHFAVDGRTDLYSLGCVAWYLLTGEAIFGGASSMSSMVAHMTRPPPSPRTKMQGWLPEGLEAAVLSCLEKDPAKRPASARALADRLRAIEIPEEHAWTTARAEAWWAASRLQEAGEEPQTGRLLVAASP